MPQSQTTTNSAPAWALPYWGSYLQGMSGLTQQPWKPYGGQRVADFSPEQYEGMGMIADRARNGSPARTALESMYGGGGGGITFSAGGGRSGPATGLRRNPLLDSGTTDLDAIIASTGRDVARDFATGTAAQNDARAARARAFGGSAYEETTRRNAESLADRLAGNASQLRYQDLGARRALEEAQLQRELQSSISENSLRAQMGAAATSAAVARMNAQDANRIRAIELGLESDYTDADRLMDVGGMRRMYSQQLLDTDYGDWRESQDYPFVQADRFGAAIGRATGGQGQTTSQTNTQPNPWANALGGGLTLAALYNMFGPGRGGR